MLGIDNFEIEQDINEIHKNKACAENTSKTPDKPLEIDNHNIHIEEHSKFILSEQNLEKIHKENLLKHIQQHKSLLEI